MLKDRGLLKRGKLQRTQRGQHAQHVPPMGQVKGGEAELIPGVTACGRPKDGKTAGELADECPGRC